jgi:3-oxoadipate enol-lactonase
VSALVLLNALGATRAMWEPQRAALAPRFPVVTPEHAARTSIDALAADVVSLFDAEGLETAFLCGVSLGGAVAMALAAARPERVERLVLACTSARFDHPEEYASRAAFVREHGVAPLAEPTLDRWFTPRFGEREPWRRMLLDAPREAYAAHCDALAAWDFRGELGRIGAPTLVVAGAEDPSTPLEHARTIAAGIAGARVAVIPGAAHLANVEQPERFSRLVLEHLAQEVVA